MNEETEAVRFACQIFRMIEVAQEHGDPESEYYRDKLYEYFSDIGGDE